MVFLFNLILFTSIGIILGQNDVTVVNRENVLLSRRKRYLLFPPGSNMAISMAGVKALLRPQPTGWNILGEMDCPFALPSDTRILRRSGWIKRSKREIYSTLDRALTMYGYNGTACITKMMCDAKKYIPMKGKSMMKDILLLVFDYSEDNFNNEQLCTDDMEKKCSISIMEHVLLEVSPHYD
ncbi:uncharacterized protein LOC114329646 [Diabrotica virgifera virgifera]|uniref:Uncharacterized protein LOC114329646 n=1 Tax=Diabrotica virgifera virgifera TaxID=50390 RepID=A0A6P7FNU8_DIAVI|nr:uncharacterized protein LOC114329646 [Diabrotica virgifera virgifera]XP_028134625.1 uncharacterized protein LOC114329646 [Diabrotica virgifera virgifera]